MRVRTQRWLAGMLAVAIVCGGSTIAWSQQMQPTYAPADSAYSKAPVFNQAMSPHNRLVSRSSFIADDASLADRVADLEGQLQEISDQAAADKEEAAGKPSVTLGGRTFIDTAFYTQDANNSAGTQFGDAQDSIEFRAARLFAQGTMFDVVDYKSEFEFADTKATTNTDVVFKDVYIAINELPWLGHVKFGHYKEPFGLNELTSHRFTTFMERSMGTNAFAPNRNMGISAYDHSDSERLTWAIGVFHTSIDDDPVRRTFDHLGRSVTGRLTYLPWYDEVTDGRGLLHTGIAYSYRDAVWENATDNAVRFRTRANNHTGPYIVDATNALLADVDDYQLLGLELAFVYGSFSVQTEYIGAFANRTANADIELHSYYIQTGYFLTGENRSYDRSKGVFGRVTPFENFFRVRTENGDVQTGKGAWEVAYRFDWIDLDDGAMLGGKAGTHTLGVNWYLNPYSRVMFNYVNADCHPTHMANTTDSDLEAIMMRFQVDF